MFVTTDDFATDKHFSYQLIVKIITDHLNCLHTQFKKYLTMDFDSGKGSLNRKSYTIELSSVTHQLPIQAREEFAELLL